VDTFHFKTGQNPLFGPKALLSALSDLLKAVKIKRKVGKWPETGQILYLQLQKPGADPGPNSNLG